MKRNKNYSKKLGISSPVIAFLGALIITLGIILASYNFVSEKRLIAFDYMNEKFYSDEEIVHGVVTESVSSDAIDNSISSYTGDDSLEHYIGYLEIPKIGFKRGFYQISSKLNTVEANIEVIQGSSMPDVEGGNLIIAGHSGIGWKAFFNELYRLDVSDEVYVLYQGQTYTYQIKNIYKDANTGRLAIKRDYAKTTLTLITCTNNDSSTQTIYVAELV